MFDRFLKPQPTWRLPLAASGLLTGILLALCLSAWPPVELLILLLLVQLRLLRLQFHGIAAFLFGFCWLLLFLAWRMDLAVNRADTQGTAVITAQVLEVRHSPGGLDSLLVKIHRCERASDLQASGLQKSGLQKSPQPCQLRAPARIRLNWYAPADLPQPGETWQLQVRLRPLRSLKNFGQPPSTGLHLAQGLVARGYVTRDAKVQRLQIASGWQQARQSLIDAIHFQYQDQHQPHSPIFSTPIPNPTTLSQGQRFLLALGLGERQALLPEDWQLLERTGTIHLWVVSGLHLGMVAGVMLWLARRLRVPWSLALVLAGGCAWGYAHLAGWGVAAERAGIMLVFGLLILSGWRQLAPWTAFALALLILLLINPLLPLTRGFWLSFGAVAILLAGSRGYPAMPGWLALIRVQWLITLGLTPLLIWQGAWFSVWAPLVNLVAVPLVGLVFLPLTLLALLLQFITGFSQPLFWLAQLFEWAALGLMYAAQLPQWPIHYPMFLWIGLLALLPPGFPGRSLAWLGLLLAFLPPPVNHHLTKQQELTWQVRVLDVGQGTAVLVESQGQTLLYDTGRGFASGWAPVVPALQPWLKPAGLDWLVISHDDQDHSGGLPAVLRHWPVEQLVYAEARREVLDVKSQQIHDCKAGDHWQMGALQVLALWPPQSPQGRINNEDSCVLLITGPGASLLLTGDARTQEEAFFSQGLPHLLQDQPLTLLVSGHHGSRTSTGQALLDATQPRWTVHTAGWRNAYGHPHPTVVQRLRQNQSIQLDTADQGAVHFSFSPEQQQLRWWRQKHRPLWEGLVE
ncbi:DNA internalization-related competence protein ComEC/Rec2 [Marinospirillum alkaliphilum]|uniref:DNA internalization-related competence protein ComEC/Rec2 n=1 Tax=Marinospirillum alkaliphilum TaxID=148454 RepID=UPI0009305D18|nr:DNA internalization-related competence protein ComEC/Rec2 [Marinospirillum alkaliphilum]